MSAAPFPKTVDALKMVEQRVDLQGKIALDRLDRVRDVLLDNSGEVEVKLSFDKDEEGIRTVTGALEVEVVMQCQRCLQPVTQRVDTPFKLGIVFSEEAAKNLPGYYDPLLLDSPEMELWQVVEEELILSLPIAATHPEGECSTGVMTFGEQLETDDSEKVNPFQVLENLKDNS